MSKVLEFLIVSIRTVDGKSGTINHVLPGVPDDPNLKILRRRLRLERVLYLKVFKTYNIMRVRMKISYMALVKQKTVKELFFEAILETF